MSATTPATTHTAQGLEPASAFVASFYEQWQVPAAQGLEPASAFVPRST